MKELPKAINCRLGDEDMDLKVEMAKTNDKTARVKELLRKGLEAERYGIQPPQPVKEASYTVAVPKPSKPRLFM